MAVASVTPASPLARLVDDYLIHCEARGLAHRTLQNTYGYCKRRGWTSAAAITALRWFGATGRTG